jgi:hypothetical protein
MVLGVTTAVPLAVTVSPVGAVSNWSATSLG